MVESITLGVAKTIKVSPGQRTFSVVAFDGSTAVARGCDRLTLVAGETHPVSIELVEYPPTYDAGVADADTTPDAGVVDADTTDADTTDADITPDADTTPDAAPTGDDCGQIIALEAGVATAGSTVASTDDFASTCGGAGNGDLVYELTIATDAHVTIVADAPSAAVVLGLRSACAVAGSELACATPVTDVTTIDIAALPAGSYAIIVDAAAGGVLGDFTLTATIDVTSGPINDSCAGAVALAAATPTAGTLTGASDQTAGSCGGDSGADAFYELVLAADQRVDLQVDATGFDPVVHVRSACGDPASELAAGCSDAVSGAGTAENQTFRSLAAGTYYIIVDSADGSSGDFTITATLFDPAPANDLCSAATMLADGVTAIGETSSAFDDGVVSCGVASAAEVYYTFTLASAAHVSLDLLDTIGEHALQLLDGCGGSELDCVSTVATSENLFAAHLPAGDYIVVVENVGGGDGTFELDLTLTPPPAGDGCDDVEILNTGTTIGQQLSADYVDDGSGVCGGAGRDRVYQFQIFSNQHVEIATAGNFDHSLYLRASDCVSGTEVACVAAAANAASYEDFNLAAGTYYVFVDANNPADIGTFQISLTISAPVVVPDNDTCATPDTIVFGTTTGGTLFDATHNYTGTCGGGGGEDVVYTFTLAAPARIRATLSRTSGSFDPVMYLRSTCDAAGSELGGGCADASASFEVVDIDEVPAGDYYIVVDSAGGTTGTFDLVVESLPVPPANDRCAGSISLSSGVMSEGTTIAARDDTTGDCSSGGVEVFYDFTISASQRVVVELASNTAQHAIYIQDECGNPVSQVACASTGGLPESIEILDLAAGTYTIIVEAEAAGGGTFDLTYTEYDPIPNDSCSSSLLLTSGVPRTGDSTIGASDDETSSCGGASAPDIIYSYILASARQVDLVVTSDFDAAVSIRGPSCTEELDEVECTDVVGGAGSESINIRTQAAGTYYVIVDGVGGASGLVDISLTASEPPPAGDYCPEVTSLAEGTTTSELLSASYADDDAGSCGGSGGADRVYSFTLSGEKQVDISTSAATFAHVIYLVATSCAAGAEEDCAVATGSDPFAADLSFAALAAGTYYLFVDSTAGTGTFDITLTISGVAAPPINDQCGSATALLAALPSAGTLADAVDDTSTSCVGGGAGDVFYSLTLTDTSRLLAQVTSTIDTSLTLRSADCTTEIICADAGGSGETLDVGYLEAGTYYLVVEGVGGAEGGFNIVYNTSAPRPENDQCGGARSLTDGVALTGETLVNGLDDAVGACGGGSNTDVVYQFTVPTSNERARITVSNASGFDPILYAQFDECNGSEEVDCAQTSNGASEVIDMPSLSAATYYVWVDSMSGGTGTFDILLELLPEVPPPSYDTCASPDALVEGATEGPFSTVGAADEYDLSCLTFDARDTVHEIDLASAAALLVTVTPQAPDWNLAAALRESCAAGPDLSCVASRYAPRYINEPNLGAGTYELIVDGDSGAAGDYTVQYDTAAADTSYGYWVLEWTDTFTPLTGATTIPITTGNPDGDGWDKAVYLPFDFDYFGTVYDEGDPLTVTDDMYISFNPYVGGSESYLNECLDDTTPHDMIAPFWDDGMAYSATAQLLYKIEGTAPDRTLTVEWRNWDIIGPAPNYYIITVLVSHQVVLFENGDIQFRYGPRQDPSPGNVDCRDQHLGCSATIGIEAGTDTTHDADVVDCELDNTTEGRVIHFVHPT